MIKGDLARDALGIAGWQDGAGIAATSVSAEDTAIVPEQFAQQWIGEGRQLANGADTDTLQPHCRGWPTSGELRQRERGEERCLMARLDNHETKRFAQLGGDHRHKLAARHA